MLNLFSSVGDAVAERIKSPILGSYTLSWCAYNWQIWPYTFEKTPAAIKVDVIVAKIANPWSWGLPLLAAMLMVLVMPFAQAGAAWVAAEARRLQLRFEAKYRQAEIDDRTARLDLREKALEADWEALRVEHKKLAGAQKSWKDQADSNEAGLKRVVDQSREQKQKLEQLDKDVEAAEARFTRAEAALKRVQTVLDSAKVVSNSVDLTQLRNQVVQILARANVERK